MEKYSDNVRSTPTMMTQKIQKSSTSYVMNMVYKMTFVGIDEEHVEVVPVIPLRGYVCYLAISPSRGSVEAGIVALGVHKSSSQAKLAYELEAAHHLMGDS
eukprot:4218764-Amphidinium_carterae.1